MRDTRAVWFIFMCNIYVIESVQITKHKEIEAKHPVNSDVLTVKNEERSRNESVSRTIVTPGDVRLKRQSEEYPPAVVLGNPSEMYTKSFYMFTSVLKGLYGAARRRERFVPAGLRPAIKMIKGKIFNMFFPPESTVENFFKWKLKTNE